LRCHVVEGVDLVGLEHSNAPETFLISSGGGGDRKVGKSEEERDLHIEEKERESV
jgi:hypothetical protein